MSSLFAGVGRSDITPAPGTPQGGWGAQTHQRGLGADMPLYATALVLSDGNISVAVIDADAIGFDREWTERILAAVTQHTGIPRTHIRFSCTHTHSGPNTFRLRTITEGLDLILAYLDGLPGRIAGAVWQAQQNLKPVRCSAGGGCCEINVNRRLRLDDGRVVIGNNWEGPVDHTVRVVRLDQLDGNPLATLMHYACHPTTMAWQCQWATPDYPGVARQVVEEQTGSTCLFLQGATGDIGPREGFTGDLSVYRRSGRILGLEAAKVATAMEVVPRGERMVEIIQSGASIVVYGREPLQGEAPVLGLLSKKLQLPLARFRPVSELEAEAEAARYEFDRLAKSGSDQEIRMARSRATQSGMRAEIAKTHEGKTHLEWELLGIRLGSVALVSVPGEPFIQINQQIVEQSPFEQTLFSGYSNGGFGYLPVRRAYAVGGYEVEISPFSADAAEMVVDESLSMLKELKEGT
ncbi:MAG: neutral/alkaline non-lysosomal ceramidase N-terminal domain-containing protein [Acidobacteriota bacterium]